MKELEFLRYMVTRARREAELEMQAQESGGRLWNYALGKDELADAVLIWIDQAKSLPSDWKLADGAYERIDEGISKRNP